MPLHPSPSGSFPASQPWALNPCLLLQLPLGCCIPSSSCHCPCQPGTQLGHHLLLWLIPASSHSGSAQISWSQSVQCIHPCPPCWKLPWDSAGCDGCLGCPLGSARVISQPSMLTLSPLLGLPLNPRLVTLDGSSLPSLSKPLIQNWDIG